MGFININGNQVHTSALSGSPNTGGILTISSSTQSGQIYYSTSTGTLEIQPLKTTYHVLGEDVEVDGYKDGLTAIMVAQLNILGKEFWEELKKQNVSFPKQLEDFIEYKFTIEETAKENIKLNY